MPCGVTVVACAGCRCSGAPAVTVAVVIPMARAAAVAAAGTCPVQSVQLCTQRHQRHTGHGLRGASVRAVQALRRREDVGRRKLVADGVG